MANKEITLDCGCNHTTLTVSLPIPHYEAFMHLKENLKIPFNSELLRCLVCESLQNIFINDLPTYISACRKKDY